MSTRDFKVVWGEILAKTWSDENFRRQVEENPKKVLEKYGVSLPDTLIVSVKPAKSNDTNTTVVLPFPEKPPSASTNLIMAADASSCSSSSTLCCCP